MARDPSTGLHTRVDNSFSQPEFDTTIDEGDADSYFDDIDAALNAFIGTSTTSLAIGTGSKTFTTQAGKSFVEGTAVQALSQADRSDYMSGPVVSYNSATGELVLDVAVISGSGTIADWLLFTGSPAAAAGAGDMAASTYDPQNIADDAFDRANHTGDQAISTVTGLQTALDSKVDENSSITGATKTKITYDAKGLVTAGADATQDDIGDGTTYKQYSATEKTKLSAITGTNTGDQTSVTGNAGTATALQTARNIDGQAFDGTANITVIAPGTHAATGKTTPVDADELPIVDSAASNILKKLTWANLKATAKTYFDTLYVAIARQVISGSGLTGGGALSADRTLAVGAGTGIVVNADDVAVDKASDANVYSAASNKVVTADRIETASALVALTDASTVAVDWDAGVNRSLTVTANRAIGNPTNGQPGTWRTITVQGSDGTDRTITFGNQYLGDVPTITDCDSGKWYLIAIFCVTTTHFVATASVAKKP